MKKKFVTYLIMSFRVTGMVLFGGSIMGATIYNHSKIYEALKKIISIFYSMLKNSIINIYTTYTMDVNSMLTGLFFLGIIFFVIAVLLLISLEDIIS